MSNKSGIGTLINISGDAITLDSEKAELFNENLGTIGTADNGIHDSVRRS